MSATTDSVADAVIATYQRELPSVHFLEDEEEFRRRSKMRENHFRFALNFPPEMFAGRRVLDLGGGTGENTIFYALWGADCTIVDANPLALERARTIFARIVPQSGATFRQANLFDVDEREGYDIVVSDGVCHHTSDKRRCFEILTKSLKRRGYCYLGIGNAMGQLQRNIQRLILYRFAESDDQCVALAERLFPEHLERASRFGQRTKRAIVFDTFINPKHDLAHVSEVLRWFEEDGLRLYSSYPKIGVPFACDGPDRGTYLDLAKHSLLGAVPELFWMAHFLDDVAASRSYFEASEKVSLNAYRLSDALNNLGPESKRDVGDLTRLCRALRQDVAEVDLFRSSQKSVVDFLGELEGILSALASSSLDDIEAQINRGQHVFHGPHGLGLSYFVGYKP